MKKGIKTRKSRFENLEERLMMAVTAGGFASAAECVASEAVNDEFIPISLGEPLQTAACPCDNPLPAPTILTGSNGYYVSYGQNNHLIAWSEVENAAGYELEYVNGKGEWFTVKTTEDHAVVANLAYGTNVTYRVRALGDAIYGSSAWSAAKSFNVCPMDIDEDGLIGPDDYALLSSAWFSAEDGANWNPCRDIDGDGFVGPGDFSYLSSNWLKDTGDEGLSYPTVNKISLTVPTSALTVPSIVAGTSNLTVTVQVDQSQIQGIAEGDKVTITAKGTYEDSENTTDKNVSKKVVVEFTLSGENAYKYDNIPDINVPGVVNPAPPKVQLTFTDSIDDPFQIPSILVNSTDNTVSFSVNPSYIDGVIDGDTISVLATAIYGDVTLGGDQLVDVVFSVTGPDTEKYIAPDSIQCVGKILTVVTYTLSSNGKASSGDGSVAEGRGAEETTELYIDFDADPGDIDQSNIAITTGGSYVTKTGAGVLTPVLEGTKYRITVPVKKTGTVGTGIDNVQVTIENVAKVDSKQSNATGTYLPMLYWGNYPFTEQEDDNLQAKPTVALIKAFNGGYRLTGAKETPKTVHFEDTSDAYCTVAYYMSAWGRVPNPTSGGLEDSFATLTDPDNIYSGKYSQCGDYKGTHAGSYTFTIAEE